MWLLCIYSSSSLRLFHFLLLLQSISSKPISIQLQLPLLELSLLCLNIIDKVVCDALDRSRNTPHEQGNKDYKCDCRMNKFFAVSRSWPLFKSINNFFRNIEINKLIKAFAYCGSFFRMPDSDQPDFCLGHPAVFVCIAPPAIWSVMRRIIQFDRTDDHTGCPVLDNKVQFILTQCPIVWNLAFNYIRQAHVRVNFIFG